MMKVLNLYAGIGGNRKLWEGVEVTAVELNPDVAGVYADLFPNDKLIVGDAHQYLLDHYSEFDFIWSSPPCPTHSKINYSNGGRWKVKYPDMKLYQEIILLQNWFQGKYVVENVISYYEPLIKTTGKWTALLLVKLQDTRKRIIREAQIPELMSLHGFDLSKINIPNKRQVLRNCVFPELGQMILDSARGIIRKENTPQTVLFSETKPPTE